MSWGSVCTGTGFYAVNSMTPFSVDSMPNETASVDGNLQEQCEFLGVQ